MVASERSERPVAEAKSDECMARERVLADAEELTVTMREGDCSKRSGSQCC
jgi:hypothetical protein